MRVSVVLCALACVCVAHAAQVFSTAELFARAAAETSPLGLSADDVLTQHDFSAVEFEALQSMSKEEFWNSLESELANSDAALTAALSVEPQHSLIEDKPAAAPKAAAKPAAKAAAKPAAKAAAKPAAGKAGAKAAKPAGKADTPALLTDDEMAAAAVAGKAPVESKKPQLPDADFANDDPYEFLYSDHKIPVPKKTDEVLARNSKLIKKLNKQLKNEGKVLMNEVVRAERNGKVAVGNEDFIEMRKLSKQARKLMKQVKSWNFRKHTLTALKAASSQIIDFEAAENTRIRELKRSYTETNAARAKELYTEATGFIADGKTAQLTQLKARALRALNKDLGDIKDQAMHNFALKMRAILYKKFGEANVEAAVKKGGLTALKKITGDKAGEVLLAVAAHLPTVGPYIRAGLVPQEAGNTAFRFVRRW